MPATATDRFDGLTTSVAVKAPCRVATTATLAALSGLQTVNGVALADGDRVLVKDQADAKANGIYVARGTAWARAKDFDGARDTVTGTIVWAAEGSANPGTFWRVTTANPVRFGTSDIAFAALDVFAALLPQTLTALAMPRVNSGGGTYELRSPAQVLGDIGGLKAGNNLSDLVDAAAARGHLGLGTMATQGSGAVTITGGAIDSVAITGVASPSAAGDAAPKSYVDSVAAGLGKRGRVRVATTANITLSGAQTIDAIAAAAGDLVLVKDQSTQSQNGIYTVDAGSWTRDANYDAWSEIEGCLIAVEEGAANADALWMCTANSGGTLGATAITFAKVSPGSGGTVTNLTASNGVKTTSGLAITSTGNLELDIASQAEAEAGSSNAKAMTPLRTAQAIAALVISDPTVSAQASDFTAGSSLSNTLYVASATLTATLPAISACSTGFRIRLKNATDGASVAFAAAGSDTIDGQTAFRVPGWQEVELTKTAALTWTVTKRPTHRVGETLQWDSNILPEGGWAWKNGQALSRTSYGGYYQQLCAPATVTISLASPGVVTHTGHPYADNQPVVLETTGALPTSYTAGTTYYIKSASTNTYQLTATPGGSAINTSGSPSGTHTALYTAYGYGSSSTFLTPDERGRAKFGKDDIGGVSAASRVTNAISAIYGIVLGWPGGDQSMQAHTHLQAATTLNDPPSGSSASQQSPDFASNYTLGGTTGSTGAGSSQNMPPMIITNFIVKT